MYRFAIAMALAEGCSSPTPPVLLLDGVFDKTDERWGVGGWGRLSGVVGTGVGWGRWEGAEGGLIGDRRRGRPATDDRYIT